MSEPKITTLCYIEKDSHYLMLHRIKKDADVNAGKWIGVGGHLEAGESVEECLLREVEEETGLILRSYRHRAVIHFVSDIYPDEIMYLYTADEFCGMLKDCDEGVLKWIPKSEIFDLKLWEGDKVFLKMLLEDAPYFELELVYEGDELVGVEPSSYIMSST